MEALEILLCVDSKIIPAPDGTGVERDEATNFLCSRIMFFWAAGTERSVVGIRAIRTIDS